MLHIVNSYIKSIFKYQKKYINFLTLAAGLTGMLLLSACGARMSTPHTGSWLSKEGVYGDQSETVTGLIFICRIILRRLSWKM